MSQLDEAQLNNLLNADDDDNPFANILDTFNNENEEIIYEYNEQQLMNKKRKQSPININNIDNRDIKKRKINDNNNNENIIKIETNQDILFKQKHELFDKNGTYHLQMNLCGNIVDMPCEITKDMNDNILIEYKYKLMNNEYTSIIKLVPNQNNKENIHINNNNNNNNNNNDIETIEITSGDDDMEILPSPSQKKKDKYNMIHDITLNENQNNIKQVIEFAQNSYTIFTQNKSNKYSLEEMANKVRELYVGIPEEFLDIKNNIMFVKGVEYANKKWVNEFE